MQTGVELVSSLPYATMSTTFSFHWFGFNFSKRNNEQNEISDFWKRDDALLLRLQLRRKIWTRSNPFVTSKDLVWIILSLPVCLMLFSPNTSEFQNARFCFCSCRHMCKICGTFPIFSKDIQFCCLCTKVRIRYIKFRFEPFMSWYWPARAKASW